MIDRKAAIDALSQIKVKGDTSGIIPGYNVLVNFLPSYFWNNFSEKMLRSAMNEEQYREIEEGLILAATECGYHTGYGIITSEEFKSVVGPMIRNEPDDILHGAYAVFTAWGWADAQVTSLSSSRMVVTVKDYYECDIRDTFQVKRPFAYMIRGVSQAFMDLAYGEPYPHGLGKHKCQQTKGIELGDAVGEFVVTPG